MEVLKLIILFGVFLIAFGFTLPNNELRNANKLAIGNNREFLIRNKRSPLPQSVEAGLELSKQGGTKGNVEYRQPINDNIAAYGGLSRDFSRGDNGVYAGIEYSF